MPRKFISDRDTRFTSHFLTELFKLEGVETNPSTAYHPQTDGQTERNNQELETFLRIWCSYHMDDWHLWLRSAQFRYNNMTHSATKVAPFYAVHGDYPYTGVNLRARTKAPAAEEFAKTKEDILKEVQAALRKSKKRMKEQYDKHVTDSKPYEKGQMVWLDGKNINTDRPSPKLEDRRYGPFKILRKVGTAAYQLAIPPLWKQKHMNDTFNERLLKPYVAPFFPSQVLPIPDPPTIINEEEHYDVDYIVDSRIRKVGRNSFLEWRVHWLDYTHADDTWQRIDTFAVESFDKIQAFYKTCAGRRKPGWDIHEAILREREQQAKDDLS